MAVQANEVTELNGGKVFYSSTNEKGDFRVGDAFVVDQSTGNVQFQATSQAQSAANITLSDGTGTTNIYPAYIETGNLRLAGNSLTSTTGQVIVDPSGQEDFVVNAETIVKEAIYFDVNKSVAFGSIVQGVLNITGFNGSTLFGASEATNFSTRALQVLKNGLGTIAITAGSGYTGGSQVNKYFTNPFSIATATSTLDTTGALKTINLPIRGSYTLSPTVTFSTGTGQAQAPRSYKRLYLLQIFNTGGTNFTSPTMVLLIPTSSSFDASSTTVNTTTNEITIASHPFETGDQISYDATTLDAGATSNWWIDNRIYLLCNLC